MADALEKGRLGKRTKLTEADLQEILRLGSCGTPQSEMATKFNVSIGYISRLLRDAGQVRRRDGRRRAECSTEGCGHPIVARGFCSRCYYAARRAGTLEAQPVARTLPPEERFFEHVEKSDDCWLWTGHINSMGYGSFGISVERGSILAHVASHEMFVGPIPEGMEVCHKCAVPLCVRPEHLYAGTHTQNMQDAREAKLAREVLIPRSE